MGRTTAVDLGRDRVCDEEVRLDPRGGQRGGDVTLTFARYKDVDGFAQIGRGLLAGVPPRGLPAGVEDLQEAAGALVIHNDAFNLQLSRKDPCHLTPARAHLSGRRQTGYWLT